MPTDRIQLRVCQINPTKKLHSNLVDIGEAVWKQFSCSSAPSIGPFSPSITTSPCLLHAVPVQPLVEKYLTDSIPAALASPFMSGQKEQNIVWVSRREFMILKKENLFFEVVDVFKSCKLHTS